MINDQIAELHSQIENLKKNKTVSLLDEFLIKVWERHIRILTKQEQNEK